MDLWSGALLYYQLSNAAIDTFLRQYIIIPKTEATNLSALEQNMAFSPYLHGSVLFYYELMGLSLNMWVTSSIIGYKIVLSP